MKYSALFVICIFFNIKVQALEYIKQFENEDVCVSYVKIMPYEQISDHYDALPSVVVALKGGTITRLEADGSITQVEFPTGKSVFRPSEAPDKIHKSANQSNEPIEMIIMQLKHSK